MNQTINVSLPQLVINTNDNIELNVNDDVTLNSVNIEQSLVVKEELITLNIESGGLVPSGSSDITLIAAANLSALRVVTMNSIGQAVYASNDTTANATVIGITTTAAAIGAPVTIATNGLITDGFWNWTKGPVFLGTNGQLTQTAPTNGAIIVHVGRALNPTTIIIDIDISITTI